MQFSKEFVMTLPDKLYICTIKVSARKIIYQQLIRTGADAERHLTFYSPFKLQNYG